MSGSTGGSEFGEYEIVQRVGVLGHGPGGGRDCAESDSGMRST